MKYCEWSPFNLDLLVPYCVKRTVPNYQLTRSDRDTSLEKLFIGNLLKKKEHQWTTPTTNDKQFLKHFHASSQRSNAEKSFHFDKA